MESVYLFQLSSILASGNTSDVGGWYLEYIYM